MAKFETALRGDFDEALNYFHNGILQGSMSASYEDESYVQRAGVRCCVRVYERYSMAGGNRLSMTLTLVGDGEDLFLSAITAGGSQGVLFKFNTWGGGGLPGHPAGAGPGVPVRLHGGEEKHIPNPQKTTINDQEVTLWPSIFPTQNLIRRSSASPW